MILTPKHALKKIQTGELSIIDKWILPEELMLDFLQQQKPEIFKQALLAALVLPGIFILLAIGNLILYQELDFLMMMFKFALASFIFIYPLSYWQQWRKNRKIKSAREVYFGDNWFLFGSIFVRWKGMVSFRDCEIITNRIPEVLAIIVKTEARGQVEQTFMIPIPENKLNSAEQLVNRYKQ